MVLWERNRDPMASQVWNLIVPDSRWGVGRIIIKTALCCITERTRSFTPICDWLPPSPPCLFFSLSSPARDPPATQTFPLFLTHRLFPAGILPPAWEGPPLVSALLASLCHLGLCSKLTFRDAFLKHQCKKAPVRAHKTALFYFLRSLAFLCCLLVFCLSTGIEAVHEQGLTALQRCSYHKTLAPCTGYHGLSSWSCLEKTTAVGSEPSAILHLVETSTCAFDSIHCLISEWAISIPK